MAAWGHIEGQLIKFKAAIYLPDFMILLFCISDYFPFHPTKWTKWEGKDG
jgi:hypothetical protein